MSEIPAQFRPGGKPQVNLLPPEVDAKRQRTRQRSAAVGFLVVFLVLIAGAYLFVWSMERSAAASAAAEAQQTADLQAKIAEYAIVDVVKAQLVNAESARQSAAAVEVFWPLMIASLRAGMPAEAIVDSYKFTMPPYNETPPTASSLFGRAPIGVVSFKVHVTQPVVAAAIEDQLNTIPFFERARVVTIRPGDGGTAEAQAGVAANAVPTSWEIEGTIDVTYDILMMRYSPYWFGAPATDTTPELESLEAYYSDYYEALIAGNGTPPGYPPLPEVTPPPFIPAQTGTEVPAVAPSASPAPSEGAAP